MNESLKGYREFIAEQNQQKPEELPPTELDFVPWRRTIPYGPDLIEQPFPEHASKPSKKFGNSLHPSEEMIVREGDVSALPRKPRRRP